MFVCVCVCVFDAYEWVCLSVCVLVIWIWVRLSLCGWVLVRVYEREEDRERVREIREVELVKERTNTSPSLSLSLSPFLALAKWSLQLHLMLYRASAFQFFFRDHFFSTIFRRLQRTLSQKSFCFFFCIKKKKIIQSKLHKRISDFTFVYVSFSYFYY